MRRVVSEHYLGAFAGFNARAMLEFLAPGWADAAAESLTVIQRGLSHLGMPANKALLEHVAPWAPAVETSAGAYAPAALQQIWAKAVRASPAPRRPVRATPIAFNA